MIIVRYADDIVVGFEHEADARRFWDAMQKRFEEFALSLHPDKTRLIEFGRHPATRRGKAGLGKPETFNFLGFTFICGLERCRAAFAVWLGRPIAARAGAASCRTPEAQWRQGCAFSATLGVGVA